MLLSLRNCFSEELYYGHTGGYADNKTELLEKINSGVYSYTAIKTHIDEARAIGKGGSTVNGELTIEINPAGEKKVFLAVYLGV